MYGFAALVVDQISALDRRCPSYREAVESLPADNRADVEERAAIMEYDGRLSRSAAEAAAIAWLRQPADGKHRGPR